MTNDMPSVAPLPTITELVAQRAANGYLRERLGIGYHAIHGFYGKGRWYFLVHHQGAGDKESYSVGKIALDGNTGKVNALTDEQIRDLREVSITRVANGRGELARDQHGHLLRYQAQLKATTWLSEHLTMHFSARDGLFIPLAEPLWQFSICFCLPRMDELKPLGVIDVDARNGQVKPLTRHQQQTIQERVREIIRYRELAPAA